jgi:hypothetical protein
MTDDWEDYSDADLSGVNSWLQERGWYGLTVRPSSDGSELEFYGGIADEDEVIRDNTTFLSPDASPEEFHEDILDKFLQGLERGRVYEWDNIPEDIRSPEMVFGTTEDVKLAGYLTPEGRFLDFSGGTGSRAFDHRQISMAEGRGGSSGMREFMNKGNIRLLPDAPSFEIIRPPTWEQREGLKQFIAELGGNGMSVEFKGGLGEFDERNDLYLAPSRQDHKEYSPRVRPEEILRDIGNFFSPTNRESWVLGNCKFAKSKEVEEAFMTSGPAPGATHRGKKCRVCGPDGEELIGKFSPSLKGEKYMHPFRAPRKKKRKKKRSKATSWVSRNCRFS